MSARGTWQRRFGLVIAATVVAVVAAEIAVRIFGLAPGINPLSLSSPNGTFVSSDNPLLKYVPKPGSPGISSYGIRDRELQLAKPPGTFRIVVVGDSVAYGYCNDHESIEPDRTFPKQLERILNQERWAGSKSIEVINLGVSGYDTSEEAEFLRQKGLPLGPDLVLIAYCLNDAMDASYELYVFRRKPGWTEFDRNTFTPTVGSRLFQHSHLFRVVWQRWRVLFPPPDVAGEKRVESALDEIVGMSRQDEFAVGMAIFPMFENFERYARAGRHRWAREQAEQRSFFVVDLLPVFRSASGADTHRFQGRCNREHPDEEGHALAARAIADYLESHRELLDSKSGRSRLSLAGVIR